MNPSTEKARFLAVQLKSGKKNLRAKRARTKGKVESGVKYLKRNFLPGRSFIDIVDLGEQLTEWNATIADQRVHGTTHEAPAVRFERERDTLMPRASQPAFGLAARQDSVTPTGR